LKSPLVNVATDEHQDKPVANLTSAEDGFDVIEINIASSLSLQEKESNSGEKQSDASNHKVDAGQNGQNDVPEPEKNEDLLVQNVHR
jgi:hypothetical protein